MIRVAGLKQQKAAGVRKRDPSGLTPSQQLFLIAGKVRQMVARQTAAIHDALQRLAGHDFHLVFPEDWTPLQRQFLAKFFTKEVAAGPDTPGCRRIEHLPFAPRPAIVRGAAGGHLESRPVRAETGGDSRAGRVQPLREYPHGPGDLRRAFGRGDPGQCQDDVRRPRDSRARRLSYYAGCRRGGPGRRGGGSPQRGPGCRDLAPAAQSRCGWRSVPIRTPTSCGG